MLLDLHMHTTVFDGQHTLSEIVKMAKGRKRCIIAVTDHDTVKGIVETKEKTDELGISLVSGIEISTQKEEEIHMLGYGIDESERHNILIKLDEVKATADIGNMGRPHFA